MNCINSDLENLSIVTEPAIICHTRDTEAPNLEPIQTRKQVAVCCKKPWEH